MRNSRFGQATIEYFALFIAIAVVTLLSICLVYPKIKVMAGDFFQEAVEKILR